MTTEKEKEEARLARVKRDLQSMVDHAYEGQRRPAVAAQQICICLAILGELTLDFLKDAEDELEETGAAKI